MLCLPLKPLLHTYTRYMLVSHYCTSVLGTEAASTWGFQSLWEQAQEKGMPPHLSSQRPPKVSLSAASADLVQYVDISVPTP